MKKNILIFYGGESVEHDISIITALQVMQNYEDSYNLIPIYIGRNGVWQVADNMREVSVYKDFTKRAKNLRYVTLIMGKPYIAFKKMGKYGKYLAVSGAILCTHGRFGEDGCLQGLLDACHIPYTSCNAKSSALCMDKIFMKDILISRKIPYVEYVAFDSLEFASLKDKIIKKIEERIGYPVILKPANLGSSIGISVCHDKMELIEAIETALKFDDRILAEKYLQEVKEYNCACFVYDNVLHVSDVSTVKNKGEIFSFEDKYLIDNDLSEVKADKNLFSLIKNLTKKVYKAFNCFGVVRVDFLYDLKTNRLFVNEINSIPGSLAFYLFKDIKFKELISALIEESFIRFESKKFVTAYDSQALDVFDKLKLTSKRK